MARVPPPITIVFSCESAETPRATAWLAEGRPGMAAASTARERVDASGAGDAVARTLLYWMRTVPCNCCSAPARQDSTAAAAQKRPTPSAGTSQTEPGKSSPAAQTNDPASGAPTVGQRLV